MNQDKEKTTQPDDMVDKLLSYSFSISTEVGKLILCAKYKEEYQYMVREFARMLRDVLGKCHGDVDRLDMDGVYDEVIQSVLVRNKLKKMTNKEIAGLVEKHLNDPEKSIFSPHSDLVDEIVERLINEKRRKGNDVSKQ